MKLHLRTGGPRPWHHVGRVHARGVAFAPDGTLLTGPALAAHLDRSDLPFPDRLGALSGTFAAVFAGEPAVAVVDRIRSLPLFYGRDAAGTLCLSDDARWLAAETNARLDDPIAAAEFMLQSATSGPSTLSTSVQQVQAGEAVTFATAGPNRTRYFRYTEGSVIDAAEDDLVAEGVRLFERAFERLIESVQGRAVAVPLSGGMDSRLIAALLVRGGRTDALCFSYGRKRSFEARASRRVAEALGLRWTFVPYTNRAWHQWFASDAFQQYRHLATGLTAIEHEQDWPAVLTLKTQGLASDAVFVPGHTGDFLSSGHLPASPTTADEVDAIWRKHYTQWPSAALPSPLTDALRARMRLRLTELPDRLPTVSFEWQERQAKMIANSVRAYEVHGFDWRLPFWADADVLDFWGRVPVPLLRSRRLYLRVLRRLMGDALFDLPSTLRQESPLTGKIRRLTDRDLGRYGIWLGPHPLRAACRIRVGDLAAVDHPVVGPVVEQLVRPIAGRPLPWATINGLLALGQLRDLSRDLG